MEAILYVLKTVGRPASVIFFLIVIGIGIVLSIVRRNRPVSRWYFGVVFLSYWVFSTPACAERLIQWSGRGFHPLLGAGDARGARVVVVLGAGNRTFQASGSMMSILSWEAVFRALEGARLYHLLDHPTVVVSGGVTSTEKGARPESEAMRDAVVQLGVPPDHVVMESESRNTRDEAFIIRRMLGDLARQPIVLVTSPTHMRRSIAVFQSAGLDPVPSTCAYKSDHSFQSYRWLPTQGALILSDTVAYDTVAWLYYQARGWVPK